MRVIVISTLIVSSLTALLLVASRAEVFQPVSVPEPSRAQPARNTCQAATDDEYYWPDGTFSSGDDKFQRAWYSSQLRAMGEPTLSCGASEQGEIYRFLWLRTFHRPIAVRVTLAHGTGSLVAIELDGAGGYEPGRVLHRTERPLAPGEATLMSARLHDIGFWAMAPSLPPGDIGLDGAQWIVEGRRGRAYQGASQRGVLTAADEGSAHQLPRAGRG